MRNQLAPFPIYIFFQASFVPFSNSFQDTYISPVSFSTTLLERRDVNPAQLDIIAWMEDTPTLIGPTCQQASVPLATGTLTIPNF
jgi:hypothetical protein